MYWVIFEKRIISIEPTWEQPFKCGCSKTNFPSGMKADYSFGLSLEDLKSDHNSRPRNPIIANACFFAGYIDTWGRGTLKIINSCKEAGLPEPEIKEMNGGVEVTIFISEVTESGLVDGLVENETDGVIGGVIGGVNEEEIGGQVGGFAFRTRRTAVR